MLLIVRRRIISHIKNRANTMSCSMVSPKVSSKKISRNIFIKLILYLSDFSQTEACNPTITASMTGISFTLKKNKKLQWKKH